MFSFNRLCALSGLICAQRTAFSFSFWNSLFWLNFIMPKAPSEPRNSQIASMMLSLAYDACACLCFLHICVVFLKNLSTYVEKRRNLALITNLLYLVPVLNQNTGELSTLSMSFVGYKIFFQNYITLFTMIPWSTMIMLLPYIYFGIQFNTNE